MGSRQIKLVRENEQLRNSLSQLVKILTDQLESKDSWIETLFDRREEFGVSNRMSTESQTEGYLSAIREQGEEMRAVPKTDLVTIARDGVIEAAKLWAECRCNPYGTASIVAQKDADLLAAVSLLESREEDARRISEAEVSRRLAEKAK